MNRLVIEYVFEGHRRGYNFTTPTRGFDDDTLKLIWRSAMPRGQGWGAPAYIGARSLKCFPVGERLALSETVVTDLQDEGGRRGIRRTDVDLHTAGECLDHLQARLAAFPPSILAQLDKKPTVGQWKRIVDQGLPKLIRDAQVVLTREYISPDDWQFVEAFVLKVATSRLNPLKRMGKITPFTTLALDYREESAVVALPSQAIKPTDEVPVVPIT